MPRDYWGCEQSRSMRDVPGPTANRAYRLTGSRPFVSIREQE